MAHFDHITIIGKSRTGSSLAMAIKRSAGMKLSAQIPARQKKYPRINSEIIIVATKDDEIHAVSEKAIAAASKKLRLIVHVAGSLPSTTLAAHPGVARLTLHPIQTFTEPSGHLFRDIYWMASSSNRDAIRWADQFTKGLGSNGIITLKSEDLPLYHAMTVLGSNFITLLFSSIEQISTELGIPPKRMKAALRPLAKQSLENVIAKPASSVLSGPIARKDSTTIHKHQKALKALDPKLRMLYDAFLLVGMKDSMK
jgi:predicted short-subunit dehydrogenase-like oxidoreductase (DUF2520 family)